MLNEKDMHAYQNNSVSHIIDNYFAGLLLDMGLGKTVSCLTAINKLMFEELDINRALVIAPKRVAESVWDAEIEKWDHLKHLKISKIVGNPKQRKEALKKQADIYILGRDNVAWMCGEYGGSMLPFDMMVIDESSSFKNPKSIRFKALKMVQPCFKRVVILTGTPAPNSLIDIWSQIYLLDRGERLGKTITSYRESFFTPGQTNGHIVYNYNLIKDSEKEIHRRIGDICISMKAKDYLDLPKRIDNFIELDFPEKIKEQYIEFEKEQVLELLSSDEEITAVNAAALSGKLLQFANGAIYDEDKNYHEIHDVKLDALEEIVENANGNPVLITYSFRHDLERILKRLKKYSPVKLSTDKDIRDWNKGKIKVLIMHPASGGHGLNLQAGGNTIVWYGQTWSLELYMQLNARLHRQGQEKPVIIHHLVIKGTIDKDVIKALKRKNAKQNGLMEAVKARFEKYKNHFK